MIFETDYRIHMLAPSDPIINSAIHTAQQENISEREFLIRLVEILVEIKNHQAGELIKYIALGIPTITVKIDGE